MRHITIKRARTWHYRKMHPCVEQSNGPVPLSLSPSWQGCITNTSGYDFRKGQVGTAQCGCLTGILEIADTWQPTAANIMRGGTISRQGSGRDPRGAGESANRHPPRGTLAW